MLGFWTKGFVEKGFGVPCRLSFVAPIVSALCVAVVAGAGAGAAACSQWSVCFSNGSCETAIFRSRFPAASSTTATTSSRPSMCRRGVHDSAALVPLLAGGFRTRK